jgi:hypothetical protein
VDSGSNCTIVGGKGADLIHFRAGGKTFPSRLKTIRTADGKQHPVTKAIELEAVLDSSRRRIRVYYVPDLQHSVILGCDFCRLFGLKIDFAGHKIEVASDIVRVPECDAVTECGADRHEITEIIRKNLDLLSNDGKLGRTHKMTVTIDTGEALPIKQRPYWWSPYMLAEVNKEIDRMLENNVISPSDSPWSSPILLVKKSSGEYRLCFDGRRLNAVTKRDSYPLPRVDRILSMLRGAKYISSIDLKNAFQKIKDALVSAPVLSSPDFSKPFVIQTDASNTGLGAVLTQDLDGDERVIAYASRSLTKAERNYSVTERECLAVLFALEKFRPYVEGTHFTIVTDHYSLLWLNRMKDPAGKLNDLDESYTRLRDNIIANPQRNPSWKVENGLVYRFVPNKIVLPGNVPEWKLLVPRNQRTKILESCHDAPTSAHFGYYKTLSRLSINHFWPKMRRSVIRYVRNCKVCNEQKAPNTARAGLMGKEKKVQFPWQMISVDLIGPLPTSTKGYSYLLVIVDWFTKYVVLFPLRKATSLKVTECIENGIFLVYGVPQFILVDNGKQFVGNEFVKTCENYKVQKIWFTAKYHPQSNPVERYNRTVGTAIRSYVKGAHKKWDAEVAKIGYAIRTAVNEVTGFSPAFLNFGRVVPCTGEFYGKVAENPETLTTADREDHAKNLEHLKTILQDVTQHLHKAHERNERSYNLRKRDAEFFVGDKVWKRNKVLSSAAKDFAQKLAPRYVLCTITRKLSKLAYALEDENRADLGVWHMKDLKEFRGSLAEAEEP